MARKEALELFLASLAEKNYYEILRAPREADAAAVQSAFHAFSVIYHPDRFADSSPDVRAVAGEVYKRGVEAYRCLSRRQTRERYDRALARGKIRIDDRLLSTRPPPPQARTLEMIATTARGKRLAEKADRLIAIGRLEDARVQLVGACQGEPDNAELAERLSFLQEALALEPD